MGSMANGRLEINTRVTKCAKAGDPEKKRRWDLEHLSSDAGTVKQESHAAHPAFRKDVS
jgi:hypothetical protein